MTSTHDETELISTRLVERAVCQNDPPHVPTYFDPDEGMYPPPCMYCEYDRLAERHRGCEHSHHRAWRRWRITNSLRTFLYRSGLTSGGGSWRYNSECRGCQTMPTWDRHRRVYVLWWPLNSWRCLLKMHHFPADPIAFGMCSKCLPCPDCGSKTAGHSEGCPS